VSALRSVLERMVDEVRGHYVRAVRRSGCLGQPGCAEVLRLLQAHSEQFLALCARADEGESRRELMAQLFALLVERYSANDSAAFWSELAGLRQYTMAAVLDVLDAMTQAGIRLIARHASPSGRDRMWVSLERAIDDMRSEYLHLLRISQGHGRFVELSALEYLPGPLFSLTADYRLVGVNVAGRGYLEGRDSRCHALFFEHDEPCDDCPLQRVLQRQVPDRCPPSFGNQSKLEATSVGLAPYSPTQAMVHLASSPQPCAGAVDDGSSIGRDVLENIGSGVVFIDHAGLVVYANSVAEELLGRALQGHAVTQALPGIVLRCDEKQHQLRFRRSCEDELLVGYRCVPCSLEGLLGTIVSFRDITETERLRQDIERMGRLSEVGRMCAVVAHEIRNPLAGISATLDSIDSEAARAGLDGPMSLMRQEVRRLDDLLTSFFAFVRHRPPQREESLISEIIEHAVNAARPHTKDKRVSVSSSVRRTVSVDRDQIAQLLINLLINAGQATPEGGEIKVEASLSADGHVLLSVEDSGCGIAQADQERIFDAFYTTRPSGTGLGLSICYRIVSEHGGRIGVQSKPGDGTRIEVDLPASAP
jgi:signal transduction histidine kinase